MGVKGMGVSGGTGTGCGCCGPCSLGVCVIDCATGNPLSGASVTVAGVGTCTTPAGGCCTFGGTSPIGDWTLTVSKAGYITYTSTVRVTSGCVIDVVLTTGGYPRFQVSGCCSQPLPGAAVTFRGATYITDSSGFAYAAGTTAFDIESWSTSCNRFTTQSGTIQLSRCSSCTASMTLAPATGYDCGAQGGLDSAGGASPWPFSDAITFTDSVYGTTTLNWIAVGQWSGTITHSLTPNCGPLSGTATLTYHLTSCCGLCGPSNGHMGLTISIGGSQVSSSTIPIAPGAPLSGSLTFTTDNFCSSHLYGNNATVSYTVTGG